MQTVPSCFEIMIYLLQSEQRGWLVGFAQLFCNLHTKSQHGAPQGMRGTAQGDCSPVCGFDVCDPLGGMDMRAADWRAKAISSNSVLLQKRGELSPLWKRRKIRERGGRER